MEPKLSPSYIGKCIGGAEFKDRIAIVRKKMDQEGVEVGLAYATEHMPGDVQYLTGYDPSLENAALLVFPNQVIVLGGPEGQKVFEDSAKAGDWRNLTMFEIPFQDYGDLRFYSLADVFQEFLGHLPDEIGLLSAPNVLSYEIIELVSIAVGGGTRFRDLSRILADARYHKSPAELEMHRIASQIATEAIAAMLKQLKPGIRELEVASEGDRIIKALGAYKSGFDTMVLSGPRINTIIGRASNRTIRKGELVLLGASPRYEGYTSALGRTVVAGGASKDQATFLDQGIHAVELAAEQLIAGKPARQVDLAARRYLESVGLGPYHTYGVGHGIGLTECLEERTATQASDYLLPTGITMMLDVGLFDHPTYYGARHEDPFLITPDGKTERLTALPMTMYW